MRDWTPTQNQGLLLTLLGVLILTPDSLLIRLIDIEPWSMMFWRGVLLPVGLMVGLLLVYRGDAGAEFRRIGRFGIGVAVLFALTAIFFILAISLTKVAIVLTILAATPLFAALLSVLFLKESVPLQTWLAILLAMAGIAVVMGGSEEGKAAQGVIGEMCALGAALAMAGTFVATRGRRDFNVVPVVALGSLMSAAVGLAIAESLTLDARQLWLMLLLGLIVLPPAFGLVTLGPRYVPAATVGLILLLETVLGPLWVWLVIGEAPTVQVLIGGAGVVLTLVLHSIWQARATPTVVPAVRETANP